ncbi:hypothetical protein [Sinobacterium norvegicum]|nr:hypothetical protein [Sinobacterium norvegicum]
MPTKADIRDELEQQISQFMHSGGAVHQIERGLSGRIDNSKPLNQSSIGFEKPKDQRTPLPDVVSELEARRQPTKPTTKTSNKKPTRKMLYDDFGEPLRWVWVE